MRVQVHKNMARCRVCGTIIQSNHVQSFETCHCGSIAISGGSERLVRNVRGWADLEELSEYLLTWRDVLDCKQWHNGLQKAADNARITGHIFFVFNGDIYRNTDDGKTIKTEKNILDLGENSPPCVVKVYS